MVKQKLYFGMTITMAITLLSAFLVGLIWSVVPMAGTTLPHHVEVWSHTSFSISALLVSFLLAMLCVSALVLFAAAQLSHSSPE